MQTIEDALKALSVLDEANQDWDKLAQHLSIIAPNKYIEIFKNNKQRLNIKERDLYYWLKKDPGEFIQRMLELENTSSTSAKRKSDKENTKKIYEDNDFLILQILSYSASKYYGKGTKWCLSGNFSGEEEKGEYYFNTYLKNDYSAFYFVLSKNSTNKWCICMKKNHPDQIKDIWDDKNEPVETIPGLLDIPEIGYYKDREEYFALDD